jgi:hypothetical protein
VLGGGYAFPLELAIDGAGNIYVPDLATSQVYLVPPGCASTSCQTSTGFGFPATVALDGAGDMFVASDQEAGSVAEVRVVGSQTTVGSGFADPPFGVAVDNYNNVFIADLSGGIVEVPSVGTQSQFAPWLGYQSTMLTDAAGDVYAAANTVTEVPPGCASSACDIVSGSFQFASGLALDNQGDVYTADSDSGTLYEWQRSQAPTLSFSAPVSSTSSPLTVAIQNIGNQPLTFASFAASANFTVESGETTCSTSTPLAVGAVCNVGVACQPTATGALTGTLTLTDNALNTSGATQMVPLSCSATAMLSIAATHATPIYQGGPGVITLSVTTNGATTQTATVSDTLDPNLTINSASSGCAISGQTVTCTMPAGSSSTTFTVYVTVATNAPALISNTATLTDSGDDVTTGSSTDSIAVGSQLPKVDSSFEQLVLSGTVDNPPCAANGTLTASVELENTGGSTLTNPYAEIDTLSGGNVLLSDSANATSVESGGDVTFTFHIQLASCSTFQLFFDVYGN